MVKKVIMNLYLPKTSAPDCILVVVLKNCEPELSYIIAELFNWFLKKSCFGRFNGWSLHLKNVGQRSAAKNYCPVSLLSVFSKIFVKIVNNRIVDHLGKCGPFSDFQYGLRSSQSTADLLTVASDRIARAFNRPGATQGVVLDISKAFDRVWHFWSSSQNLSLMELQVRYSVLFLFFSVIDHLEWFWMDCLHKNTQLILEFLKDPFLVLHFSYYRLITFLINNDLC